MDVLDLCADFHFDYTCWLYIIGSTRHYNCYFAPPLNQKYHCFWVVDLTHNQSDRVLLVPNANMPGPEMNSPSIDQSEGAGAVVSAQSSPEPTLPEFCGRQSVAETRWPKFAFVFCRIQPCVCDRRSRLRPLCNTQDKRLEHAYLCTQVCGALQNRNLAAGRSTGY